MRNIHGIPVSPGVAIGEALVIDTEGFRIPHRFVDRDAVEDELDRWRRSVAAVLSEIERHRDVVARQLGDQYAGIFAAQQQMLCDPKLQGEIEGLIRQHHYSPEHAVCSTLRRYAKVFQNLENRFMAERAHDIIDIEKRLLRDLLGREREELAHLRSPVIVLAHNLTPSEAARLNPQFVLGIASEMGGPGGHTAIIVEALEIPALVGAGRFLTDVSGGETVIVDGDQGLVILDPDSDTLEHYRGRRERHRRQARQLERLRELPCQTADGVRVYLYANIEFPREVEACLARGADGIGLYRTEFLYLDGPHEPSEEDHYHAYASVVQAMEGRPVVIRTLDLGADKMGLKPTEDQERNPFLGLRSIRLSLRNVSTFRVQLKALLRASALGDVRVMFPMISTFQELRQARSVLVDTMEDLEESGTPFNRDLAVGMMVEVPAVVMLLDRFVREVDFISIGTNDLIQYALAVDRSNRDVAGLYNAADPAVLYLIQRAADVAQAAGVPATLCGQMSSNPIYVMLLLGMGLRSLSVPPAAIPEIKHVCRSVTLDQCRTVVQKALTMENAMEVTDYLTQELDKVRLRQTADAPGQPSTK